MQIFISWSGERSKTFAKLLKIWLHTTNHLIKPWMSMKDLRSGDRWLKEVGEKLSECHVGVICVTPENVDAPWLIFEAGAISKTVGEARVCPVLLGMSPSDLRGPLAQFQATTFDKEDMLKLILSLNEELEDSRLETEVITATFSKFWPELLRDVNKISKIVLDSSNLKQVLDALRGIGFPRPSDYRILCFKEGFESHHLYDAVFPLAKKRLYIYGRKNRKVFDKEHWEFMKALSSKISNGFDFRCLFLNPKAPGHIVSDAHENSDFPKQLRLSIKNASSVLSRFGVDTRSVCRAYRIHRHNQVLVVDNAVLFTHIEISSSGKVKALTNREFEIVDADMPLGKKLISSFQSTWDTATPLTGIDLS